MDHLLDLGQSACEPPLDDGIEKKAQDADDQAEQRSCHSATDGVGQDF